MRPYHIIVAVDGSDEAGRAVDWAAHLAKCDDIPLTVVHVMPRGGTNRIPQAMEEFERIEHLHLTEHDLLRSAAEKIVGRAAERATQVGAPKVDTAVLVGGDPATVLAAEAEDLGANLVVMGCRGLSNVPGMMLGSVSHRMLHLMDRGAVLAVH